MKYIRFYGLAFVLMLFGQLAFADELSSFQVTQEERRWLTSHPVIRVGMDSAYAPYEWLDKEGHYVGMAVDYLRLLEKKIGVRFEIVHGKSWIEILEMAKKGEIHVVTSIVQTPERLKYFIFSSPYRNTQTMIVDNGKGDFVGDLKRLAHKKVAVERGYFVQEILETHYPKIECVLVNTTAEALQFVQDEKVDAYVGDMSAIDYAIKKDGLRELRFSGQTEFASEHRFAFPKSHPEIASIMTKAMELISEEESNAIFNRWLGMRIQQGVKVETIVKYSVAIVAFLVLFGYMYYRLQRETAQRKAAEAYYRQLTEDVLDVIWRTDKDFYMTYISPSDERLRGYKAEEVLGRHVFEMFTSEGVVILMEQIKKRRELEEKGIQTDFERFQIQHRCKDGSIKWGEVLSKPERNAKGEIIGYHGITREITQQKQMQDQVQQLAFYDVLTKLPNRLLLKERLQHAIARSRREKHYSALMFFDLDNFKSLNDTYGHSVGDLLLYQVAQRVKECIREIDTVARFGGDEFVVILSSLHNTKEASKQYAYSIAEKIRLVLSAHYLLPVQTEAVESTVEHHCTASIGVLVFDDGNEDDLLRHVDAAMYKAKEAGKNTIHFYD